MSFIRSIVLLILMICINAFSQYRADTLLFSFEMDRDSGSLKYCPEDGRLDGVLGGPVVVEGDRLMLYSDKGYMIYSGNGELQEEKTVSEIGKEGLDLAFPETPLTLLLKENEEKETEIYRKPLGRGKIRSVDEDDVKGHSEVDRGHLFNLCMNSIFNELKHKYNYMENLVGYTDHEMEEGIELWAIESFFSATSPFISLKKEGRGYGVDAIFTGIRSRLKGENLNPRFIEPRSFKVFENGRYYFSGVTSDVGNSKPEYKQSVYLCDIAGNIIYTRELLKQTNTDEDVLATERHAYTMKKVEKYVFPPVFDSERNLYYGVIDYKEAEFSVYKSEFFTPVKEETEPALAHLFDIEEAITYQPVYIGVRRGSQVGLTIPNVTMKNDKGEEYNAEAKDLTRKEYIVRIFRPEYQDVLKKFARVRVDLPEEVESLADSLSDLSTIGAPYAISLSGPGGVLNTIDYPVGDNVLCARVVGVADKRDTSVAVRVDCRDYAEVLLFTKNGRFINSVVFNTENYKKREDYIVLSSLGRMVELDNEKGREDFFRWYLRPEDRKISRDSG